MLEVKHYLLFPSCTHWRSKDSGKWCSERPLFLFVLGFPLILEYFFFEISVSPWGNVHEVD